MHRRPLVITAIGGDHLAAHLDIESDADVSPVCSPRLQGTAVAPPSGVTWGSNNNAGPAYTWNGGGALARTVQSGTQRLHLAYATTVLGVWADNNGPYVGVYYVRSSTGADLVIDTQAPQFLVTARSTVRDSRPPARVSTRRGSARRSR